MHYTQYLVLTYKICRNRQSEKLPEEKNEFNFFGFKNYQFVLIILIYGLIMSLLSRSNSPNEIIGSLIIIPITGQILHLYLDAFLWRFSIKHNREVTLKHIYN